MDLRFKALESSGDLSILNGLAFEEYLSQLFMCLGYEVDKTRASGDYGADLILRTRDKTIAVQAKQYASEAGFDAVKEVHFARTFYDADEAWIVCTGGFTKQAERAAESVNVRLFGPSEIDRLIEVMRSGKTLVETNALMVDKQLLQWNCEKALRSNKGSRLQQLLLYALISVYYDHGAMTLAEAADYLPKSVSLYEIAEVASWVPYLDRDCEDYREIANLERVRVLSLDSMREDYREMVERKKRSEKLVRLFNENARDNRSIASVEKSLISQQFLSVPGTTYQMMISMIMTLIKHGVIEDRGGWWVPRDVLSRWQGFADSYFPDLAYELPNGTKIDTALDDLRREIELQAQLNV